MSRPVKPREQIREHVLQIVEKVKLNGSATRFHLCWVEPSGKCNGASVVVSCELEVNVFLSPGNAASSFTTTLEEFLESAYLDRNVTFPIESPVDTSDIESSLSDTTPTELLFWQGGTQYKRSLLRSQYQQSMTVLTVPRPNQPMCWDVLREYFDSAWEKIVRLSNGSTAVAASDRPEDGAGYEKQSSAWLSVAFNRIHDALSRENQSAATEVQEFICKWFAPHCQPTLARVLALTDPRDVGRTIAPMERNMEAMKKFMDLILGPIDRMASSTSKCSDGLRQGAKVHLYKKSAAFIISFAQHIALDFRRGSASLDREALDLVLKALHGAEDTAALIREVVKDAKDYFLVDSVESVQSLQGFAYCKHVLAALNKECRIARAIGYPFASLLQVNFNAAYVCGSVAARRISAPMWTAISASLTKAFDDALSCSASSSGTDVVEDLMYLLIGATLPIPKDDTPAECSRPSTSFSPQAIDLLKNHIVHAHLATLSSGMFAAERHQAAQEQAKFLDVVLKFQKSVRDLCAAVNKRLDCNTLFIDSLDESTGIVSREPANTRAKAISTVLMFSMITALQTFFKDIEKKAVAQGSGAECVEVVVAAVVDRMCQSDKDFASTDERDDKLTAIANLCDVLESKDVVLDELKKRLSSRLLKCELASRETEESVIRIFKQKFHEAFVHSMQQMLNDLDASKSILTQFVDATTNEAPSSDFTVKILTTAQWPPLRENIPLRVPQELSNVATSFGRFYCSKNPLRKLAWNFVLSTAECSLHFVDKNLHKSAAGSLIHIIVLIALRLTPNGKTVKELVESCCEAATAVDERARCTKLIEHGLRDCENMKLVVSVNDRKAINPSFTHKNRKFVIASGVQAARTVSVDEIDVGRKYRLDAAIVRVMKLRRELPFSELVPLTIEQVSNFFVPDRRMILGRVDDLIAKEYLRRDDADRNKLVYLA